MHTHMLHACSHGHANAHAHNHASRLLLATLGQTAQEQPARPRARPAPSPGQPVTLRNVPPTQSPHGPDLGHLAAPAGKPPTENGDVYKTGQYFPRRCGSFRVSGARGPARASGRAVGPCGTRGRTSRKEPARLRCSSALGQWARPRGASLSALLPRSASPITKPSGHPGTGSHLQRSGQVGRRLPDIYGCDLTLGGKEPRLSLWFCSL